MRDYNKLELHTLIDLLAKYTSIYTGFMSRGIFSGKEFTRCKQSLAEIHDAIKAKKINHGQQITNLFPDFTNKKLFSKPDHRNDLQGGDFVEQHR